MKSLARILKDYQDAGALHELVSVQSVIGEGVFATKSGDLMMILRMGGVDYEGLDPDQVDAIARRFEAALRIFDEDYRIYQYLLKRDSPAIPCQDYANPVVQKQRNGVGNTSNGKPGSFTPTRPISP
jgi:type IV secretory pathway VirB4 component